MKIDLFDLPSDKIYIQLEDGFHKNLFKMAITKAGSQSKLAEILKRSEEKFAKDLKYIRQQEVSKWYNNYNFLRLEVANFLIKFVGLPEQDLRTNLKAIKGMTTSSPILNPKFPFTLDYEMSQLLGKICGDGCVQDFNSYSVDYVNKCEELLDEFKRLIIIKIGNTKFHEIENNGVTVISVTGLVGYIFTTFFDFVHSRRVPNYILNGNEEVKRGFLRAIFDDEGTVSKYTGQIKLKMIHKRFVCDIKSMLKDLGIITTKISKEKSKNRFGKIAYYFTINGRKNLELFLKKISFTHPEKLKKLTNRLNSYKLEEYQKMEPQRLILDILSKDGSLTAKELATKINRKKRTIQFHLNNLRKKNKLTFQKIKRKFVYEYLWVKK